MSSLKTPLLTLSCSFTYDMIIVDLFVDALAPQEAEEDDFLVKLNELIESRGLILFNQLMYSSVLCQQSEEFSRKMTTVLPGTKFIKAHSNRMLYYEKVN